MFSLCDAMSWAHLPVAGGIYDQHPELLEDFLVIFERRGRYEQEKAREREAQAKRPQAGGGSRRRR